MTDVRRSVAALHALPTENRPLAEALAGLAEECRASGIAIDLTISGTPRQIGPQAELTLYRAAQEGLTNVRKHAQAERATVALDYGADNLVRVVIEDDGVGANDANSGFGLLGVRERAQILGGAVRTTTSRGRGFKLEVELPGMSRIRILIVDDQSLFREGLRTLLSVQADLEVVAEAANGEEALRQAAAARPDVVLMDLQMPVLDGVAATRRLRREQPESRVIVLDHL